ncbi:MAG: molybdopterin-binding protein [Thermostichus sp. BF3_bins_97]
MPRKEQGWITFQTSAAERQHLEQYCQLAQRSKTDVLRELLRSLDASTVKSSSFMEPKAMQISARNVFKGTVKSMNVGMVSAEIVLEIAPGIEITGIISKASAERLGLTEGKEAYAAFKASDVMLAVD